MRRCDYFVVGIDVVEIVCSIETFGECKTYHVTSYHHSNPMTNQISEGKFSYCSTILSSDENSFISVCILRGYWMAFYFDDIIY